MKLRDEIYTGICSKRTNIVEQMTDYAELTALADRILDDADDDDTEVARLLSEVDPDIRSELLDSDLFNAYQVFYYYFRTIPIEFVQDKLMLESASSVKYGIFIGDYGIAEMHFMTDKEIPIIILTNGDEELKRFSGHDAYICALDYAEENAFI